MKRHDEKPSAGRNGRWAALALALLLPGACLAQARPETREVLDRVQGRVENFIDQFSAVKCTERVSQMKLGKNGKVERREESVFDYLALLQVTDGELTVSESRLLQSQDPPRPPAPLLVTNGFSTLLLVFHPFYGPSFEFEVLADENVDGKRMRHILFHHRHGTPSPSVLLLRGREYPLDLAGEAWVDPETGTIVRILATLESPLEDLGLRVFRSDVHYEPVQFTGLSGAYWLPATATIDVQTPRQHWRNLHRFTAYQHFAVDTQTSIGGPQ